MANNIKLTTTAETILNGTFIKTFQLLSHCEAFAANNVGTRNLDAQSVKDLFIKIRQQLEVDLKGLTSQVSSIRIEQKDTNV